MKNEDLAIMLCYIVTLAIVMFIAIILFCIVLHLEINENREMIKELNCTCDVSCPENDIGYWERNELKPWHWSDNWKDWTIHWDVRLLRIFP